MVDVVVDGKSMAKLPYDPDVIPSAVKKRAAAVDALYNSTGEPKPLQANGSDGSQPPSVTPKSPQSPEVVSASPQAPPEATPSPAIAQPAPAEPIDLPNPLERRSAAPEPPEDENSESYKQRFLRINGAYTAAQKTIGEMQEQMVQMGNELLHAQRQPQRPPPRPPAPPRHYLTEQDVQNYGGDLLDVTQRAAMQVVAPHLERLEGENAELRTRLAQESRRGLDQAVEIAVPNFREIDNNPRWHNWLLGIDLLSGRVRQELLNEAIAAASAPRVISFFRGFLREEAATGHIEPAPSSQQASAPREPAIPLVSLAAPGRARPASGGESSVPTEKPTYTRAQLRELYAAYRKGAYAGREADWARIDADIIAAGREGRIFN